MVDGVGLRSYREIRIMACWNTDGNVGEGPILLDRLTTTPCARGKLARVAGVKFQTCLEINTVGRAGGLGYEPPTWLIWSGAFSLAS